MSKKLKLDYSKIKFSEKIISTEEVLKDIEPLYSKEEIEKLFNNKVKGHN